MAYTKAQREVNAKKKESELESKPIPEKTTIKKLAIKNLPLYTMVSVKNNLHNPLQYISTKTGLRVEWANYDITQPLSLEELIAMRNSQRKFFEKTWISIKGFNDPEYEDLFSVEEILDFLQVKQCYSNSLCPNNIDDIFSLSPDEIEKRVPNMSSGIKNSIIVRANELIKDNKLDSFKIITTLEKVLNCELSRPS